MSKRFLILAAAALVSLVSNSDRLWARGMGGGFHGGGGGGGFHGGEAGRNRGGEFGGRENRGGGEFHEANGGNRGYQAPIARDAGWEGNRFAGGPGGAERAPTGGELNHFLGLPSDQGFHQMTGHPTGMVNNNAGQRGAGNPNGQWNRQPNGQWNHQQQQAWANGVRNNYNHWNGYNAAWYADHPGAWAATGWGVGAAWNATTWAALGTWFGGWNAQPVDYAYGNNIAYDGDQVYVDGQDAESAADYYDQVAGQAEDGAGAEANADGQWLPLGVFALAQPGQPQGNAVIQLAVDKEGILRGNYTDTVADETSLVQGAVDEKSQRVAWTIGDNEATVMETGLYNLTQPAAPVLIHFGAERTQQWTLVRLNQDSPAAGAAAADPPAPGDAGDN